MASREDALREWQARRSRQTGAAQPPNAQQTGPATRRATLASKNEVVANAAGGQHPGKQQPTRGNDGRRFSMVPGGFEEATPSKLDNVRARLGHLRRQSLAPGAVAGAATAELESFKENAEPQLAPMVEVQEEGKANQPASATISGAVGMIEDDAFVEECTKALSQKLKPPKVGNEELYESIRSLRTCLKSFMSRKDVFVSQCVTVEQELVSRNDQLSKHVKSLENAKKASESQHAEREQDFKKKLEMAKARSQMTSKDLDERLDRVFEAEKQLEEAEQKLEEQRSTIRDEEREVLMVELQKKFDQADAKSAQLEQKEQEMDATGQRFAELTAERDEVIASMKAVGAEAESLREKCESLTEDLDAVQKRAEHDKISAEEEMTSLKQQHEKSLEEQLQQLTEQKEEEKRQLQLFLAKTHEQRFQAEREEYTKNIKQKQELDMAKVSEEYVSKISQIERESLEETSKKLEAQRRSLTIEFEKEKSEALETQRRQYEDRCASMRRENEEALENKLKAKDASSKHRLATALEEQQRALEYLRETALSEANELAKAEKLASLAKIEADHRIELDQLRTVMEEAATAAKAEHEQNMASAEEAHANTVAELREQHASEIAAAREAQQAELDAVTEKFEGETNTASEEHAVALKDLQEKLAAEHEEAVDEMRKEHAADKSRSLNELKETLQYEHEQNVSTITTQHEKAMADALERQREELECLNSSTSEDLLKRHNETMQAKEQEHADALAELEEMHAATMAEREASLAATHATAIADLESSKAEELATLEQKHESKMEESAELHATEMSDLNAAHEKALDALNAEHSDAVTSLNEKHTMELQNLREELESQGSMEMQDRIASIRAEHDAAIAKLVNEKDAELETLKQSAKDELEAAIEKGNKALQKALDNAQEEHDELVAKHEKAIRSLNETHEAEMESLKSEYSLLNAKDKATAMAELRESLENSNGEHRAAIERAAAETKELALNEQRVMLEATFVQEKQKVTAEHQEELDEQRSEAAAKLEEAHKQKKEAVDEWKARMEAIENDSSSALKDERKAHEKALEACKDHAAEEIAAIEQAKAEAVAALEKELADARENAEAQLAAVISEKESSASDFEETKAALVTEHESKCNELTAQYEAALDELKAAHELLIADTEAKHKAEADELHSQIESAQTTISTMKSELAETQEQTESRLAEAETERDHLSRAMGTLQSEIDTAQETCAKLENELSELRENSKSRLAEVEAERERLESEKAKQSEQHAELVDQLAADLKEQKQSALADLQARWDEAEARHAAEKHELENANKSMWENEKSNLDGKIGELSQDLENQGFRLAGIMASLESEQSETARLREVIKNEAAKFSTREMELNQHIETQKKMCADEEAHVASLKAEIEATAKMARAQAEDERMEQLRSITREVEALKYQVEQGKVVENKLAEALETIKEKEGMMRDLEADKRMLHNTIQELRGNVRVFARVRPMGCNAMQAQKFAGTAGAITAPPSTSMVQINAPCVGGASNGADEDGKKTYKFGFDAVFGPDSTQDSIFVEVSELVQSALDGYKVCLFCYGQTGSGKTHTMLGTGQDPDSRGIVPRAVEKVIEASQANRIRGWEYNMEASYVEIYNEMVRDLLSPGSCHSEKHTIISAGSVQNSGPACPQVSGVQRERVTTVDEAQDLVRRAAASRKVEATQMNATSSRSHTLFMLYVTGVHADSGQKLEGFLCLVDLAGSERIDKSGAEGARLKEACAINKSLSSLSEVFNAISKGQKHIPYRNSKLTHLLAPCLGGDGKALMFVNLNGEEGNADESLASLRFASTVNSCELGLRGGGAKRNVSTVDPNAATETAPPAKESTARPQTAPASGRPTRAASSRAAASKRGATSTTETAATKRGRKV